MHNTLVSDRIYLVIKGRKSAWQVLCKTAPPDVVVSVSYGLVSDLVSLKILEETTF